jgi:hypothetical protein
MTLRAGRRLTPWLLALAGYIALTLIVTWPLVLRLSTVVPHDAGDPLLTTWILWWNAHTTPLTERWWNAPIFWPMRGAMALSEHMLGLSLVATPLQWLGAGPITAYNILFLLSFPLCAIAAHALGYTLTGRHDAAALAGLVFAFNPYRTSQLAHLHILWSFWMPLALTALHRYARGDGARWLAVFAIAWLGQALSNGYFQLFFPLLLGLWTLWFLASTRDLRRLGAVAAAWGLASVALLPVAVPYVRLHARLALERRFGEVAAYSADLSSLAHPAPLSLASSVLPATGNAEQLLFPGFTALALIALAAFGSLPGTGGESTARRRLQLGFGALACGLVVVALVAHSGRPWALRLGETTIVSVTTAVKPLTAAIWFGLFAVAASGGLARARRARSAFAFYICAAAAMYVLSFGPLPSFHGSPFWYRAPYAWLMALPGFSSVRAPARFAMLAQLCLAATAALAVVRIRERLSPRIAAGVVGVAIAVAVADGWIRALPLAGLPERFAALETLNAGAVAELPVDDMVAGIAALYRSIDHHRPTVNGYSGFVPNHYQVLRAAIAADGMEAFDALTPYGPLTFVDAHGRIVATREERRPDPAPAGRPLPIQEVKRGSTPLDLGALTDGDSGTRWDSNAPQNGSETIAIDLGSVSRVNGVTLAIGPYYADFPRRLTIEVSDDQQSWTSLWNGRCGAKAVAASVQDARMVPLTVSFPPASARYIRLRQVGTDSFSHWSIAELVVYSGAAARSSPPGQP